MRSNTLLLLAGLASYALGLPTDLEARTFGHHGGKPSFIHDLGDIFQGHSPANILDGMSPHAAAALGGGALGCKAGSIDIEYRKELAKWIHGAGFHLDVSIKKSLLAWCDGDDSFTLSVEACAGLSFFIPKCAGIAAEADLVINLEGVFSLVDNVVGVLTATAQTALSTAIGLLGEIDAKVKIGLDLCAAGGVVSDLAIDVLLALKAWLKSSECTLSVSLKASVLAWCEGKIEGDVISLDVLPPGGLATISVGNAVLGFVEETGILIASAQTALSVFLDSEFGVSIDIELLKVLKGCAGGKAAAEFSYEARAALAAWLSSSSCGLTVELKAVLLFWLSFSVTSGVEVSIDLSTDIISQLTSFLLGTVDTLLGTNLHGLLSIIISGESLLSISLDARAQLAAICGGAAGFEIDASIQIIIIGWLTGCHECCHGGPPGLPSPTPTETPAPTSTPCETDTETTETPAPTSTPCETETETTETPVPTSTPCETITSETVIPSTTSIPVVPTPSSPGATGGESSTPCETITTETTISSTISETPAPSSTPCETITSETVIPSTTSIPVVPTPSSPGATGGESSTPCETITTETTISSTISETPAPTSSPCETITTDTVITSTTSIPEPSGPDATETSTPCETFTTETVITSTTSIPEVPTPSVPGATGSETSTPCETITTETLVPTVITKTTDAPEITAPPVPTSTKPKKTVTLTTTVSVAYCPPTY